MEVGLPFKVPQETGVRRKQQGNGGEKNNKAGLKVQEKKGEEGKQSREGMGRADGFSSFRVCQSSRILAAGFCNVLSDKSSFVPSARRFPSFPNLSVYGLLARSRKLFFYWRKTKIWKGHEQGAPIGTGQPEPNCNPPQPAGSFACGRAAKSAASIPDRNHLLRKVFEGAFVRAFQILYVKRNTISSADGFFNTRLVVHLRRGRAVDSHAVLQQQL